MIIAIDTGATKTLVTSFEANQKHTKSHRFATSDTTQTYIETLTHLINGHYDLEKASAIVIGSRGLIEGDIIVSDITLNRKDFKIVDELRAKLQTNLPIFLENDANLAGLAEIYALVQKPKVGLYVTVSTGIGTGIIVNNVIEPTFRGSEGGEMMLEFDGVLRPWESFASGRSIFETYGAYARDIHDKSTWETIADKISRGLLAIIPLLRPDSIVIGGSIGTYFDRYNKTLNALIKESLPLSLNLPRISQAQHPEEAVIYGCNIYANQKIT